MIGINIFDSVSGFIKCRTPALRRSFVNCTQSEPFYLGSICTYFFLAIASHICHN